MCSGQWHVPGNGERPLDPGCTGVPPGWMATTVTAMACVAQSPRYVIQWMWKGMVRRPSAVDVVGRGKGEGMPGFFRWHGEIPRPLVSPAKFWCRRRHDRTACHQRVKIHLVDDVECPDRVCLLFLRTCAPWQKMGRKACKRCSLPLFARGP